MNFINILLIIAQITVMQTDNTKQINTDIDKWFVVNDNVMGGLSNSSMSFTENETLVFKGKVSLDNNGVFASVRLNTRNLKIKEGQKLKLVLIGDSKEYQIRIKPYSNYNYNYSRSIKTTNSKQTIIIPLNEFSAQFRGRKLKMSNFNYEKLSEIGILIGNKKNEDFRLEIIKIELTN
jgi:NADH dehydrogenase [ubiquinone] 1 alpha subcomplex assembly factor 1